MGTKEIITLQLGQYANFVGTHWWNIQESSFQYGNHQQDDNRVEIDHDILFREGKTARGEITFTPRLVLTELKGGLGSLTSSNVLYQDIKYTGAEEIWNGITDVHEQPPEKKNPFLMELDSRSNREITAEVTSQNGINGKSPRRYSLEEDVKVWSDFLRTYLHPKSFMIVNNYQHGSENDAFDLWTKGANLKHILEDLEERIRFYAEECDSLQGFHILADSHNGFAGLASTLMQYLHDEFSSKQLATFPMFPAQFHNDSQSKACKRDLNRALFLPVLLENSSLVCPLSLSTRCNSEKELPHLIYDAALSYHTGAILAAALDTVTLNHRLKGLRGMNMDQFCHNATSSSKNLASLSISMPVPILSETGSLHNYLNHHLNDDPWTCITPDIDCDPKSTIVADYYSQSLTLRGMHEKVLDSISSSWCTTPEEMLQFYLDTRFRGCPNSAYVRQDPLKISVPFPQFFDEQVGQNGFIGPSPFKNSIQCNGSATALSNGNGHYHVSHNGLNGHGPVGRGAKKLQGGVESVPVITNMQCTSKSATALESAVICLQRSRKRHFSFHCMESENVESDIEYLRTMQDEYKGRNEGGSDSDGDF